MSTQQITVLPSAQHMTKTKSQTVLTKMEQPSMTLQTSAQTHGAMSMQTPAALVYLPHPTSQILKTCLTATLLVKTICEKLME